MTEKRFKLGYVCGDFGLIDNGVWIDLHSMSENSEKNVQICINKMNALAEENEQLKQQRIDLLRLIENNIEIYENINTNVEFHQGEIQGKLTVLHNLRKVMLND